MLYPLDSEIKEENDDFEQNENYLQLRFDVNVKIENEGIHDGWCAGAVASDEAITFANLKQECLHTCIICCNVFYDSYSLLKHNITHLKVPLIRHKLFMCDSCPAYYKDKKELERHILSLHPPKPYISTLNLHLICKICKIKFPFRQWLSHMKVVHRKLDLKCDKCNKMFKDSKGLKRHILFLHKGVKPSWRYRDVKTEQVKCPKCPQIFTNKFSLSPHIRNCHSDQVYECEICHSNLKSKPYLQTHMSRVHYNDGILHACDICKKSYKSARYLKIHRNVVHLLKNIK